MKNQVLVYTMIICLLPFVSWTQTILVNKKKTTTSQTNSSTRSDKIDTPERKVKYYHVEEIFLLKFGGHKTVYNVSNLKLVPTYDLGPNNKRIVTPVYDNGLPVAETITKSDSSNRIEKYTTLSPPDISEKKDPSDINIENSPIGTSSLMQKEQHVESLTQLNSSNAIENKGELAIANTLKKTDKSSFIDIIKIYEGVAEKGYETLEILKKLANSYYFSNELEKSVKYYSKLFNTTTDLEPEYYYRYSASLKSAGQLEKADAFLKKFNQLSGNSSKE